MYENFPKCLGRNSFRFQFSHMHPRPNSPTSLETVNKLAESQIGYIVKRAKNPDIGLSLTEDDTYFKGFYNDLGLAHCLCYSPENIDEHYDKFIEGDLRGHFGYIYENAAAQQLKLAGLDPHYFSWTETKDSTVYSYEVDFAFERHGKVQPVECRSSSYHVLKSLDLLESKHMDTVRKGIVITSNHITKNSVVKISPSILCSPCSPHSIRSEFKRFALFLQALSNKQPIFCLAKSRSL